MQSWQIFLLAFSGLGVFNSLAFIIYLQINQKQFFYKNIFLQFILFAFVLQITKAVLELFEWEHSFIVHNMYLFGILTQGPVMYLFLRKSLDPGLKIWPVNFVIHILPYLIYGMQKFDFHAFGIKEKVCIAIIGCQTLTYIILCVKPYLSLRRLFMQKHNQYYIHVRLYPAFALLWLVFPLSAITNIDNHLYECLFYSAFVYYLIFLKSKEPKYIKEKYKFSDISEAESLELYNTVVNKIIDTEIYLYPDITLTSLAKNISLNPNTLSQVINQNSQLNFRDFINNFRIEKAKDQIIPKVQKGFTIASVAFDSGFNSLSSFNRAFKKVTGYTPSGYIKSNG